jgi:hypothetical protein
VLMEQSLRDSIRTVAIAFQEGRLSALEAAVALAPFEEEVDLKLRECLTDMVAVASEMDAIPLGSRRELWHPDVRAREDEKHDCAQAWAEPIVRATCERLLSAP